MSPKGHVILWVAARQSKLSACTGLVGIATLAIEMQWSCLLGELARSCSQSVI